MGEAMKGKMREGRSGRKGGEWEMVEKEKSKGNEKWVGGRKKKWKRVYRKEMKRGEGRGKER